MCYDKPRLPTRIPLSHLRLVQPSEQALVEEVGGDVVLFPEQVIPEKLLQFIVIPQRRLQECQPGDQ